MGLLDDAIREHLELKRRRGADPGTVAQEAQEALGSVRRTSEEDAHSGHSSHVGQETVEINMEAELQRDAKSEAVNDRDQAEHPTWEPDATDASSSEDSLEWEVPSSMDPHEVASAVGGDDDEALEDVLEETPDFLRETPEQERLWFEQRPPRDFDFDE